MTKNIYNVLLAVISIFVLIFIADGANNTLSIHNNPDAPIPENGTSDTNINKTILSNVNNTEYNKSKVSIKIYRTPKKISGFDIVSIMPIIVIIYYLKIKKR